MASQSYKHLVYICRSHSISTTVVKIDERIYWVLVSIPILFFLVGVFFLCWNQCGILKPCCCICCGLCKKMEKEDLNPNYGADLDEASYVMEVACVILLYLIFLITG